jgi:adenosylhomocysteinase
MTKTRDLESRLLSDLEDHNPKMPLSARIASGKHNSELIFIHHLDKPARLFMESIAEDYKIRLVIGIPYSSRRDETIKLSKNFRVIIPDSLNDISRIIRTGVESNKKNLIIQDIGGYTTRIAAFLDSKPNVIGVVEDTNQGHWLWEKTKVTRLPILSIAQSKVKRMEDPFVAKAIVYSVYKFLKDNNMNDIRNRTVLVLGYGNIGNQICVNLKPICREVIVYDKDPAKMLRAYTDGFLVSRDFRKVDTIIGATGNIGHSVHADDLKRMNDGTVMFSGSSKRIEFDLKEFRRVATRFNVQKGHAHIYGLEEKDILVANSGEPINHRFVSLPTRILDLVFASLAQCANILDNRDVPPGLNNISDQDQKMVINNYLKIYGTKELKNILRY